MKLRFYAVSAVEDRELPQTNLVVHVVDTGDTALIRQKTMPYLIGARAEFKKLEPDLLLSRIPRIVGLRRY